MLAPPRLSPVVLSTWYHQTNTISYKTTLRHAEAQYGYVAYLVMDALGSDISFSIDTSSCKDLCTRLQLNKTYLCTMTSPAAMELTPLVLGSFPNTPYRRRNGVLPLARLIRGRRLHSIPFEPSTQPSTVRVPAGRRYDQIRDSPHTCFLLRCL